MAANKLPVQEIDARLAEIARSLSGAAAPPPPAQTPIEYLNERSAHEMAAEAHRDAMEKKCINFRSRLEAAQANARAGELALKNAVASLSEAVMARDTAAAACAAPAAQATLLETLRNSVEASLGTCGAEDMIK